MEPKDLKKELIEFLEYIKEERTDSYGQLEVCDTGDELDPTIENVVDHYLTSVRK